MEQTSKSINAHYNMSIVETAPNVTASCRHFIRFLIVQLAAGRAKRNIDIYQRHGPKSK